jgi:hypothetical protein
LAVVIVPVLLAVLSGLFLPEIRDWLSGSPKPDPTVSDVVVGTVGRSGQPRVEFALHNNGDRTSVLQRVSFTVRAVAVLKSCFTGGDLSVAKSYGVNLPIRARTGQVIETRPLRRQLRSDEAERLAFNFGLSGAHPGENAAYALAADLRHDDVDDPTPLGDIAILVGNDAQVFERSHREEVDPSHPGKELVRDDAAIRAFGLGMSAISCMRSNTVALHKVITHGGKRSRELSRLGRWLLSPEEANAFASKYGVQ